MISNDVGTGCLTLLGFLLNILFISVSPSQGLKVNHLLKVHVGVFYCQILNVFHLNWTRGKTDDVCVRIIGMYTMDLLSSSWCFQFFFVYEWEFCLVVQHLLEHWKQCISNCSYFHTLKPNISAVVSHFTAYCTDINKFRLAAKDKQQAGWSPNWFLLWGHKKEK